MIALPMQESKIDAMLSYGLIHRRPDGTYETEDAKDKRIAHNQRMRFNRSFQSAFANTALFLMCYCSLGFKPWFETWRMF